MAKKTKNLLTLEQLAQFCEENKFYKFSAKSTGYTLSVQVPGNLNFSDAEDEDLLYTTVKVCHTLLNRNGSYISEENMRKAMPSLKYKPLLASIVEDENGELDFNGHDMSINEDGSTNYIEKQIGTFTVDEPYLKYDEEQDKTYVIATAVIPREYTPSAAIIEKKNGTKVSCELRINEMQYNAKEKYLELIDFVFSGVCCLGESVSEGMLGSRLDITDFSTENNSLHYEKNDKLIEVLEKLNTTLSSFQIDNNQRKEETEVDNLEIFEDSTVTEEVVEESTEEVSVTEEGSEETVEETPEVVEMSEEVIDEEVTETVVEETGENFEEVPATFVKTFEISHDDIRYALYNLLTVYEEADNEWYYISAVYDNYFAYENYNGNKIFGQAYTKDDENIAFDGERWNLHRELLTDQEYAELKAMRANYSSIQEQLKAYQLAEENEKKDALFTSSDYASIIEKDEVKELIKDHSNYSLDELTSKLDGILLANAKAGNLSFAAITGDNKVGMTRLPIKTTSKMSRYGSIFKK